MKERSELDELRKENARLASELEEFVSRASHDLKSPAGKVLAFARLLEADLKPATAQGLGERDLGEADLAEPGLGNEAEENLALLMDSAHELRRLVDQLGDYASAAGAARETEPVDLGASARRALMAIGSGAAAVELRPLPTIEGSRRDFDRLFEHLIGNALKYVAPGEAPRVVVDAVEGESGWRLEIVDEGIGIDPKDHERIFRPFERLHGASRYPGAGLGLAICARLAERHRARIDVESQPGAGARFRIHLPADARVAME